MKLAATILVSCIFLAFASSADILQNADFEQPPLNWEQNTKLDENSTIPGWTFQGLGEYLTSGSDLPIPSDGHAILLDQDGKINQTFTANGDRVQYLLTFAVSRKLATNCTANASLVISAPDSSEKSSLTSKYGREPREVYGILLGSWGNGEPVNLVLQSEAVDADPNSTCWPIVDSLSLVTSGLLDDQIQGNLLPNGGFESGPAFPRVPDKGVLIDSEPSIVESALQQWTVIGTVKYIDARNYFVPEGKSAVELVSGISSGVQTVKTLTQGSNYTLEFMLGDANDSCAGDFVVGVTAGSIVQNYSVHSDGNGSAKKYSIALKGSGSSATQIGFQSYTMTLSKEGVYCGPVIDGVVLHESAGHVKANRNNMFISLLLLMAILSIVCQKY